MLDGGVGRRIASAAESAERRAAARVPELSDQVEQGTSKHHAEISTRAPARRRSKRSVSTSKSANATMPIPTQGP